MVGEINKGGLCENFLDRPQYRWHEDYPSNSFQRTGWTSQDRAKSLPDPRSPHLGLVGLWTQLEDTGKALRSEEQSQGQGPRVSMLRWVLADIPL